MKLTKFGILVNKTTSLFTSIRDSNISRGVQKLWKFRRGGGVIRQIPSMGVVWIFSGTTHLNNSAFRAVKRDAIKVLDKVCERDTICQ